jgi:hypothetical protein
LGAYTRFCFLYSKEKPVPDTEQLRHAGVSLLRLGGPYCRDNSTHSSTHTSQLVLGVQMRRAVLILSQETGLQSVVCCQAHHTRQCVGDLNL